MMNKISRESKGLKQKNVDSTISGSCPQFPLKLKISRLEAIKYLMIKTILIKKLCKKLIYQFGPLFLLSLYACSRRGRREILGRAANDPSFLMGILIVMFIGICIYLFFNVIMEALLLNKPWYKCLCIAILNCIGGVLILSIVIIFFIFVIMPIFIFILTYLGEIIIGIIVIIVVIIAGCFIYELLSKVVYGFKRRFSSTDQKK